MAADKILVVEDDPDFRFILERALKKNKYEVKSASNGAEALKVLENYEPKVVVADWMMPQMDGIQLCDAIKQQEKFQSIYFILLTARSSLRDRVTGLDVGADDFLIKPVENQELLARIRSGIRVVNLQNTVKQAEHSKALIEMACTIGHQINNPLSSLSVTVKSLENDISEDEKFKEEFSIMKESIDRIQKFVEALKNIEDPEIINYANDQNMLKMN